ncbi:13921_t:CDS:2, partial [Racocetra persica]
SCESCSLQESCSFQELHPLQGSQEIPSLQESRETPPSQESRETPPSQESRETPLSQESQETSPLQGTQEPHSFQELYSAVTHTLSLQELQEPPPILIHPLQLQESLTNIEYPSTTPSLTAQILMLSDEITITISPNQIIDPLLQPQENTPLIKNFYVYGFIFLPFWFIGACYVFSTDSQYRRWAKRCF